MNPAEYDDDPQASQWQPVSPAACLGLTLGVAVMLGFALRSEGHWVPLLDETNLMIHEAGHPLVGMLWGRLMVYGGTLLQLLFPLFFVIHFYRETHAPGCAVGVAWFGENLLNVGRYMADARAQLLPLVGGGEHDWTEIFSRWHVLHLDTRIGGFTRGLGTLIMVAAVIWLWRLYQRQRQDR